MRKWEYKFFSLPTGKEAIEQFLNELGSRGWENPKLLLDVDLVFFSRPQNLEINKMFDLWAKQNKDKEESYYE